MNNDLISREALKKAYFNAINETSIGEVSIIALIDNAPTVESDYEWGYSEGVHDTERPQGEWNYIQAEMCVCPFCGAYPHKDYKNFCPNCGAYMRGKENGIKTTGQAIREKERDCENCEHHKPNANGFYGCELWECKYKGGAK